MNIFGGFKNFLKSVGAMPGKPSMQDSWAEETPKHDEPAYSVELSSQSVDQSNDGTNS